MSIWFSGYVRCAECNRWDRRPGENELPAGWTLDSNGLSRCELHPEPKLIHGPFKKLRSVD